ncbi:hypothetical protein Hanom_Chr03g00260301 [Helianthus anomalus]
MSFKEDKAIGLVVYCNLIKASWMHLIDHYASGNYDPTCDMISVQIIEYRGVISKIFKCFGNGVDGYCDRVSSIRNKSGLHSAVYETTLPSVFFLFVYRGSGFRICYHLNPLKI